MDTNNTKKSSLTKRQTPPETMMQRNPDENQVAAPSSVVADNEAVERRLEEDDEDDDSMKTKQNKRTHGEAFPTEAELSLMSKPERKRHREKRRRDRVNASFDQLRSLLIRVDPQCASRVDISQLELVDRSIVVIKGLFDEISRCKELLKQINVTEGSHQVQQSQGAMNTTSASNYSVPFVNPFEIEPAAAAPQSHTHQQFQRPHYGDQLDQGYQGPVQHHLHDGEDHSNSPYVHHHLRQPITQHHPESTSAGGQGGGEMSSSSSYRPTSTPQFIAPISNDYGASSGYNVVQQQIPHQQQQVPKAINMDSGAAIIDLWSAFSEPIHPDDHHPPPSPSVGRS